MKPAQENRNLPESEDAMLPGYEAVAEVAEDGKTPFTAYLYRLPAWDAAVAASSGLQFGRSWAGCLPASLFREPGGPTWRYRRVPFVIPGDDDIVHYTMAVEPWRGGCRVRWSFDRPGTSRPCILREWCDVWSAQAKEWWRGLKKSRRARVTLRCVAHNKIMELKIGA